jgi:multiple sugar transport system substrate-binding protein
MNKRFWVLISLLTAAAMLFAACAPAAQPAAPIQAETAVQPTAAPAATAASGDKVKIKWYIGLGTGGDPEQQEPQKKAVADFNASHPNIELQLEVVTYNAAYDTLATELASGNPPDVVGPVGTSGAEAFHGAWLDLTDLIKESNYDLSNVDPQTVAFFKTDQGQLGLPFAIYPSELYYQPAMFDEVGLNYPPHKYGDKYKMPDGSMVDWNYDTFRKVAMMLTVDKKGKTPNDASFDPTNIVQYGFVDSDQNLRAIGNYWGPDNIVESDGKTVKIPDQYMAAWKWWYDGMWKDHFIPTQPVIQSPEFGATNSFNSGKFAMSINHLWYTCCIESAGDKWNIAAIPAAPNGKPVAEMNADTFRITKSSKHPKEAFEVVRYLINDQGLELLKTYGGFPARKDLQKDFLAALDEKFPQKPDWQVMLDAIPYQDIPNFEAFTPNYQETTNRIATLQLLMSAQAGLNMDQEIAKLKTDLQAIYDKKTQ